MVQFEIIFSFTPGAQQESDLIGVSMPTSKGSGGNPGMDTYTVGISPGVIGDIYRVEQ